MQRSSLVHCRASFVASLPILVACNGAAVRPAPTDPTDVEDTVVVKAASPEVDPDPCAAASLFHDVRAYAPADDGGEVVATGPTYGAGGHAAVHRLDAHCREVWAFDAAPDDELWILRVASDAAGNAIVAGSVGSASQPGVGAVLLMKLDPGGHLLWRLDSHVGGRLSRILLAPAGDLVVSGRAADEQDRDPVDFVARYDAAGHLRWQKPCGDTRARVNDLTVTDGGEVLVAGRFSEPFDFGGGVLTPVHAAGALDSFDAFLLKLGAAGDHRWSERFGDEREQSIDRVSVDASGEVTVRGRGNGTIDLGGGPLVLGDAGTFAARFDAAGHWLWSALETGPAPAGG